MPRKPKQCVFLNMMRTDQTQVCQQVACEFWNTEVDNCLIAEALKVIAIGNINAEVKMHER